MSAMSQQARNFLKEYYRQDVEKLSKLVERDLSHWLS
jgi:hypothetical protein